MALREADAPSPNRGYAKRTPDLEASNNACFRAYSPELPSTTSLVSTRTEGLDAIGGDEP
jgi:hypothetical protein